MYVWLALIGLLLGALAWSRLAFVALSVCRHVVQGDQSRPYGRRRKKGYQNRSGCDSVVARSFRGGRVHLPAKGSGLVQVILHCDDAVSACRASLVRYLET